MNSFKYLFSLVLLIGIFSILSVLFLFPKVENIQETNQNIKSIDSKISNTHKLNTNLDSILKQTTRDTFIPVSKLKTQFYKYDFTNFAKRYFKSIKITDVNISSNEEMIVDTKHLEIKFSSPKQILNFLEDINYYQNSIKIKLPINIKSQNGLLYADFDIEIYALKLF